MDEDSCLLYWWLYCVIIFFFHKKGCHYLPAYVTSHFQPVAQMQAENILWGKSYLGGGPQLSSFHNYIPVTTHFKRTFWCFVIFFSFTLMLIFRVWWFYTLHEAVTWVAAVLQFVAANPNLNSRTKEKKTCSHYVSTCFVLTGFHSYITRIGCMYTISLLIFTYRCYY